MVALLVAAALAGTLGSGMLKKLAWTAAAIIAVLEAWRAWKA
jgi:hypothetical protein